ncbi:PREDICTED: leucine aminopeptidase 1-like isoform X2 [Camelina sativa]|uniref:Leucine aminopeptidase 1-like isoform X2 n=1 Tax=Camelina sativa TaxID=90675 RepID=A0ABM0YM46_CAMSA|nr:PREDICTED: leucine aminopeptidase 1-like isoform X2 [Camelina sativa]
MISFTAKEIDVIEWKGDVLVVGVTDKDLTKDESSKFKNPILNKLDDHLSGLLAQVSSEEDFNGKPGQSTVLRLPGLGAKRITLIGLGHSVPSAFHSLGDAVVTVSKASQSSIVAVVLASSVTDESKLSSASGIVLGLFEDSRYKSESKKPSLKFVDIIGFGTGPELEKKLKYAEDVSYRVIFGRELTNSPANVLTPGMDGFKHCHVLWFAELSYSDFGFVFWHISRLQLNFFPICIFYFYFNMLLWFVCLKVYEMQ